MEKGERERGKSVFVAVTTTGPTTSVSAAAFDAADSEGVAPVALGFSWAFSLADGTLVDWAAAPAGKKATEAASRMVATNANMVHPP